MKNASLTSTLEAERNLRWPTTELTFQMIVDCFPDEIGTAGNGSGPDISRVVSPWVLINKYPTNLTVRFNYHGPNISGCPCPAEFWTHHPTTMQVDLMREGRVINEEGLLEYTELFKAHYGDGGGLFFPVTNSHTTLQIVLKWTSDEIVKHYISGDHRDGDTELTSEEREQAGLVRIRVKVLSQSTNPTIKNALETLEWTSGECHIIRRIARDRNNVAKPSMALCKECAVCSKLLDQGDTTVMQPSSTPVARNDPLLLNGTTTPPHETIPQLD